MSTPFDILLLVAAALSAPVAWRLGAWLERVMWAREHLRFEREMRRWVESLNKPLKK